MTEATSTLTRAAGEILVELYLEGKYRLYKEKIEARNGHNGEKDRCGKAVHQGQQHDNNQIGGLGCDLVEPELDARPAYESQENAARQPKQDHIPQLSDSV